MTFWIWFWQIVFIVWVLVFGGMAVWVTIGGFRDIKLLFKRLNESHQHMEEE